MSSPIIRYIVVLITLGGIALSQEKSAALKSGALLDSIALQDSLFELESASADFELTQAVIVQTDESSTRRWISISTGALVSGQNVMHPAYTADSATGNFSFILDGVDTTAYLGHRKQRDTGYFPIQYEITFPDSERIAIRGRTLPFSDASCYYSFDLNDYRLDFSFKKLDQPANPMNSSAGNLAKIGLEAKTPETGLGVEGDHRRPNADRISPLFYNALFVAGAAMTLVLLVFIGVLMIRKMKQNKTTHTFAEFMDAKSPPEIDEAPIGNPAAEILTPELREEKIRALMVSENISYDEAALRVQYESLN